MLVARDDQGRQVLAWQARAGADWRSHDRIHFCPECGEPVFIKHCVEKITHFSHYPNSSCSYGAGEGPRHVLMKAAVMDEAKDFEGVRFEEPVVPGRRTDVVIPPARVVVECQASAMSPDEWRARTRDYSAAGWSVLWVWDTARIVAGGVSYQDCVCLLAEIPKEIRLCHKACYGQVTALCPDSGRWYSVHIDYLRRGVRCIMYEPLGEDKKMIKETNLDGLRLVNLARPWWTRGRAA